MCHIHNSENILLVWISNVPIPNPLLVHPILGQKYIILCNSSCLVVTLEVKEKRWNIWVLNFTRQSPHQSKPPSVDTLEIVLWHRNNFTVTEKYFILWQGNTLYVQLDCRYTFFGYTEILYIVTEKYFISPPLPNISIWKAGSQKFSHHFYLGHSWKLFRTNNHKESVRVFIHDKEVVIVNFSKYAPLAISATLTPMSYAIQIMESSFCPLVTE